MNACIQMVAGCVLRDWDILLVRKREDQSFAIRFYIIGENSFSFFPLFYNYLFMKFNSLQPVGQYLLRLKGYIYETIIDRKVLESKLSL